MGDRAYQFTCLPFGLSSAPWDFTKTLRPVVAKLRELGIRLVIYLDDMLVIAKTSKEAEIHTSIVIYTLENLVHPEKSLTQPTRRLEFLGMIIDSVTMECQLPGQKIKSIRSEARRLASFQQASSREVSCLVGKITSITQAIPPAPLFYRALQRDVSGALARSGQNYDAPCNLSPESSEELQWWIDHLTEWNGKSQVRTQDPDITIESDASLTGWGATSGGVDSGGHWGLNERQWHINCLEIQAAKLAVQTFVKNRSDVSVLLLLDNTTAVAYINHLGGPPSHRTGEGVVAMVLETELKAQHLPGRENVVADRESRVMRDRYDWMLNPDIFSQLKDWRAMDIDLFASRLTNQLPTYFSWRPDPATDAFTQSWSNMKAYANPPWNLIGRVLAKLQESNNAQIVLKNPTVAIPTLVPSSNESIDGDTTPPTTPEAGGELPEVIPRLVMWPISSGCC